MATVFQVPITKGGKTAYIAVNSAAIEDGGDITEEVMHEVILQGLKVILNRGMTKITGETYPDEKERQEAAMKKAKQTFEEMKRNEIRFMGKRPKKEVTGEVMTEAMKMARAFVRQKMKDAGIKISHVPAKEITKVAKDLVAENPELIEKAKATVEARKEKAAEISVKVDLQTLVDPKLVAKTEKEKAERKAASSAKKAGKVEPHALRQKGQVPQPTAH